MAQAPGYLFSLSLDVNFFPVGSGGNEDIIPLAMKRAGSIILLSQPAEEIDFGVTHMGMKSDGLLNRVVRKESTRS